ncbi:MAG: hemolysin family protein [Acidimicrobiales bacterium]
MDGLWPQVGLVVVLVLLNAAFAGSELALVSLREGQLRRLEQRSSTGAVLARLAREPNRFMATIQVGITLAGFLASASAAVSLSEPLEERLDGALGGMSRGASIVLVTLVLSYFTLVLGELVPKRIAMQRAERWGLVVARPLSAISQMTRPVVWLLSRSTDIAVRLLGGDPNRGREPVTEEELRDLVASHRNFSPQQRMIIEGAFEISQRTLHEVLRPRPDVFVVDAAAPCGEAQAALAASGHSRAPVVTTGSLDDVIGIVHLRDLLSSEAGCTAGAQSTPATIFPESLGALDALRQMQVTRVQMAVVVNEHGGAEGIITVEDLIEELVGEIYDETDRDVLMVRREPDGSMVLPGRFPAHDLPDLGIEVPEGQYATVAGFLLWQLQRIPDRPGDVVDVGQWRMTITAVDDRAITEIRVSRASSADAGTPVDPDLVTRTVDADSSSQ